MKTTYQCTISALFSGAIALGTAACDTTGANISGRDINGPVLAPKGPIGSSGSAGSTGSGSGDLPPEPKRNPGGDGQ
jgi:hypothetical protein